MTPAHRAKRAVIEVAAQCDAQGEKHVFIEDHKRHGYMVGATTLERSIYGYTLTNAKAVQRILATAAGWPGHELHESTLICVKTGKRQGPHRMRACLCKRCKEIRHSVDSYCTIVRAESELSQAIAEPERYAAYKSAGRMRKARAAAVDAGKCIVCRNVDARADRKTCQTCSDAAAERMFRRRYYAAAARDDARDESVA